MKQNQISEEGFQIDLLRYQWKTTTAKISKSLLSTLSIEKLYCKTKNTFVNIQAKKTNKNYDALGAKG